MRRCEAELLLLAAGIALLGNPACVPRGPGLADCRSSACDPTVCGGRDVPAEVATLLLRSGDCFTHELSEADLDTGQVTSLLGLIETDLQDAFVAAGSTEPYDFVTFGSVWVGACFDNPDELLVRASSVGLEHDYLMICFAPQTAAQYVNDASFPGAPDPWMVVMGSGVWLCIFAAAPFTDRNPDPFGTIEVCAE